MYGGNVRLSLDVSELQLELRFSLIFLCWALSAHSLLSSLSPPSTFPFFPDRSFLDLRKRVIFIAIGHRSRSLSSTFILKL